MTRQAWVTLPSCLASSNRPTFALITFRSVIVMTVTPVAPAGALRFALAPRPGLLSHRFQPVRQTKSRLLHVKRLADGSKVFGCQEKNAFTPLPLGDTST